MIKIEDLLNYVLLAKNYDNDAMMKIIDMFSPLINKYYKIMGYDEDFKSDITEFLIVLIRNIKINKFHTVNTPVLVRYISKALYHQYIALSRRKNTTLTFEISLDNLGTNGTFDEYSTNDSNIDMLILNETAREILTEREFQCFTCMVVHHMSAAETAEILKITRQTANEAKLRGIKKLKKLFCDNEL